MKPIGIGLLSLLTAASAMADIVVVQKVEGMGNSTDMTLKIKGDMIRVDPSTEMTTIMNNSTGEMTSIMHTQKKYVTMSGEDAKKAMTNPDGGEKPKAPEPKATGEKEKIKTDAGEFETEKFTFETATGVKGTYWIAKDYPDGQKIVDQMNSMMKGPLGESLSAGTPDMTKLPGLPIKTVVEMEGQDPVTSTIVSAKEEVISDDEFKVPTGYEKIELPGGN